jgi:L-alanine-DL-glutamate epimerase-like enolase superfamily enzyme
MESRSETSAPSGRRGFLGGAALGMAAMAITAGSRAAAQPGAGNSARTMIDPAHPDYKIIRVTATPIQTRDTFDYGGVRKPSTGVGVYVEVETAGGLIGHGMTTIIDSVGTAALINGIAAPAIIGQSALNSEAIWETLYWRLSPRGQTGFSGHVMGAVDIALWDIKGKALGVPIATLIGGARASVPNYVTFGPAFLNREELVAVAKDMVARGYWSLKMVVGNNALPNRDRVPMEDVVREDIARVQAVRGAVGDKVHLHVDGNCSFDLPNAERLSSALRELDLDFFEEPITQNDVRLMAELRRRTGIRIAAGQNEALSFRFRDMLLGGAVDYVQPNVMIGSGYTHAVKIAGMAAAFNIGMHNGGAGALQNMHLHAGLANGGYCEWHLPWMLMNARLYSAMPEPVKGRLAIPRAPGLGFEADPAAVREFAVRA